METNTNTNTNTKTIFKKVDFDFEPSYTYANFLQSSVELLFHYIRFKVFPQENTARKKELFKALSYVACRNPDILKEILHFCEAKNLEGLLLFAKGKALDTQKLLEVMNAELKKKKLSAKYIKSPEVIIEGYFIEENPFLAYKLLSYLLNVNDSDKDLKQFCKNYASKSEELRALATNGLGHSQTTV